MVDEGEGMARMIEGVVTADGGRYGRWTGHRWG
jgi:hypothetical protein